MLKQVLKTFFVILSVCFLSFGTVLAEPEDIPVIPEALIEDEKMELVQNDIKIDDLEIEPIDTKKVKDNIIPDTKKEGKKVIGLFLKTMVAVALSAIILYFILIFVRKFYSNSFTSKESMEEIETLDLATPNTKQEAFRIFLNKSK